MTHPNNPTAGEDELTIYLPSFPIIAKPRKGSPCNGCGWCCHEEICMVGKVFLELYDDDQMIPHFVKGPCPLMDFVGGKVRCGLVLAEERSGMEPKTKKALGCGEGCCADDPHTYKSTQP